MSAEIPQVEQVTNLVGFGEIEQTRWWFIANDLPRDKIDAESLRIELRIDEVEGWQSTPDSRFALPEQKMFIFLRDGRSCLYCDVGLDARKYAADHVLPYSRGGKTVVDNLACACKPCNKAKSDLTGLEFAVCLQAYGIKWRNARYLGSLEYDRLKYGYT